MPVVKRKIERPSSDLVKAFKKMPSALISNAMNGFGAMDSEIKPLFDGAKICGPAITVREMVGCNIMIHKAIKIAEKGDVIVVDGKGHKDTSLGGWIICLNAKAKGIEALVIDGAWRDVSDIRRARYPVFCRAIVPNGPHKGYPGDINLKIQCGGATVSPGDLIVGDDDGIVVVPPEQAEQVLERAEELSSQEEEVKKKIMQGEFTVDIYGFEDKLKQMGVKEE